MSCFSGVLNQSDAFASLNRAWTTGSRPVGAVGLSETGKALVLHALYEQQKKPLLVLTPDEASAVKLTEDLRTLQGDVLLYPAREMNFVQVAGASHEYELLRLFLSHPGMAFTRDQLFNEIWGMDYCGETRTVDMHIRTLRQKLGSCGSMIQTVRNVGYRLEVGA